MYKQSTFLLFPGVLDCPKEIRKSTFVINKRLKLYFAIFENHINIQLVVLGNIAAKIKVYLKTFLQNLDNQIATSVERNYSKVYFNVIMKVH